MRCGAVVVVVPRTLLRSVSKSPTLIPASPWHWVLIGSVKDQADHVLQFYNFTPDRKFYTGIARGACNKYQGCGWSCLPFFLLHRLLGQNLLDHWSLNPVVVLLDQGPSFSHLREKELNLNFRNKIPCAWHPLILPFHSPPFNDHWWWLWNTF